MKFSLALLTFFFLSLSSSRADTHFNWRDSHGVDHRVHVRMGKTSLGEKEIRVTTDYSFLPEIFPRDFFAAFEPLFLVGHDTDRNGYTDFWFVINNAGIVSAERRESQDSQGLDIIKQFLAEGAHPSFKQSSHRVYRTLVSPLLSSIALAEQDYDRYLNTQMQLIEAESLVDSLVAKRSMSNSEAARTYRKIRTEWEANWRHFHTMSIGSVFWANSAVDVASFLAISRGLKLLGAFVEKTSSSVVASEIYQYGLKAIESIRGRFNVIVDSSVKRLQIKESNAILRESAHEIGKRVHSATVPPTRNFIVGVAQGVKKDAFYIALTQTTQVVVETSARWNNYTEKNPLKRAGMIFTDKDFLQNVLYMTNETILTNGLLNHLEAKSFVTKMFAMGVVSFINSNIMSYGIKDSIDPARATFDTAWEIIPGNSQTIIDNYTRNRFRELAVKKADPRFAWAGMSLNLLDQAIGYYLYNAATKFFEKNPEAFQNMLKDLKRRDQNQSPEGQRKSADPRN
jgi:hypothetical protein